MQTLPLHFVQRHQVLIDAENSEGFNLLYSKLPTMESIAELKRVLGKNLQFHAVKESEFEKRCAQIYADDINDTQKIVDDIKDNWTIEQLIHDLPKTEDLIDQENDAPIIRFINALLRQAIQESASDIHIEVYETQLLVRFRIDGVLRNIATLQAAIAAWIISRIKIMAKLNIAEKRLPQDGRMALRIAGRSLDVRVSTIPAIYAERIVLRLLDQKTTPLELTALGMSPNAFTLMQKLIQKPHGIFLVTGPTGSGKTTTLYAVLNALNHASRNILTVEDPIEYNLPGIGQTPVNEKVGMTFSKGLRAILRQDPDVVMVGEIRDKETADVAVQASLTGHLVLSTLHTNSAVGAIIRLRDLGVATYLLSSTLIGVVAQRLVRKLCFSCKEARTADAMTSTLLNSEKPPILFYPRGCESCGHTGYKGRMGLYEMIILDDALHQLIEQQADQQTLENYARRFFSNLRQEAYQQVLSGTTTLAEIERVIGRV